MSRSSRIHQSYSHFRQAEETPKKEERPKSPNFLAKLLAPFKNGEKKAEKKVKEKTKKTDKKEEVRRMRCQCFSVTHGDSGSCCYRGGSQGGCPRC